MTTLKITILGDPRGWGRPTPVAKLTADGKPFVTMVTQKETKEAKKRVLAAFRAKYPGHVPFTGPVMLRFTAVFPVPESWPKAIRVAALSGRLYHTSKPDKDNIEKLVVDALTRPKTAPGKEAVSPYGYAWIDDAQVMGGGVKRYGSVPRVDIELTSLVDPLEPATPAMRKAGEALAAASREKAGGGLKSKPTKSQTNKGLQPPPDLSSYSGRQRELIERALARDAAATRKGEQ